jgi:hypothetical protein
MAWAMPWPATWRKMVLVLKNATFSQLGTPLQYRSTQSVETDLQSLVSPSCRLVFTEAWGFHRISSSDYFVYTAVMLPPFCYILSLCFQLLHSFHMLPTSYVLPSWFQLFLTFFLCASNCLLDSVFTLTVVLTFSPYTSSLQLLCTFSAYASSCLLHSDLMVTAVLYIHSLSCSCLLHSDLVLPAIYYILVTCLQLFPVFTAVTVWAMNGHILHLKSETVRRLNHERGCGRGWGQLGFKGHLVSTFVI